MVFVGGGLGSVLRFAISRWLPVEPGQLPCATLAANLISCLVLGFLFMALLDRNDVSYNQKLFFTVGFCGGFSTFSTFSLENMQLLESGHGLLMAINIVGSVALGIAGIWLGFQLARWMML